jgi:protein-S-isoprenylcysteine O-methyltransferase Ste14
MIGRICVFVYGFGAYVIFLGSFLYAVGFVGNRIVPKSIDSGDEQSLAASLLMNIGLLSLFAVQHSGMARPAFKQWWTRIIPQPVERSTYVLLTSLLLLLLFWQWRPLPQEVWSVKSPFGSVVLQAIFCLGWLIVLATTFMIDHFDLFGLKQTYYHLTSKTQTPSPFITPVLYRYVRHPIMLGFVIAFWATPVMSVGHLLFAAVTTAYILLAIQLEERDLVKVHGDQYREYRRQTSMLLPWPQSRGK